MLKATFVPAGMRIQGWQRSKMTGNSDREKSVIASGQYGAIGKICGRCILLQCHEFSLAETGSAEPICTILARQSQWQTIFHRTVHYWYFNESFYIVLAVGMRSEISAIQPVPFGQIYQLVSIGFATIAVTCC
ncbi:MAG TPA: hypothetical protein VNT76_08220 [Candidatus Binatus sp.]|nr:hypothetical protein [Candidatus Binatus sp.]